MNSAHIYCEWRHGRIWRIHNIIYYIRRPVHTIYSSYDIYTYIYCCRVVVILHTRDFIPLLRTFAVVSKALRYEVVACCMHSSPLAFALAMTMRSRAAWKSRLLTPLLAFWRSSYIAAAVAAARVSRRKTPSVAIAIFQKEKSSDASITMLRLLTKEACCVAATSRW